MPFLHFEVVCLYIAVYADAYTVTMLQLLGYTASDCALYIVILPLSVHICREPDSGRFINGGV